MEIDKVLAIDKEIEALNAKKKEILDEIVDDICPYKIGDIVNVHGYSHVGKKCRIVKRFMYKSLISKIKDNFYTWKVGGIVLKKSGEESNFKAVWDSHQDPSYNKK